MCDNTCKRHTTKFCSAQCAGDYRSVNNLSYGGPKKILTLPRACQFCEQEYNPISGQQKYCNLSCAALSRRDTIIAMAKKRKGYKFSAEVRQRMSIAASKRAANRNYTKGVGGYREDIGHYVRSRWEANVCRYLKHCNLPYTYESSSFTLYKEDGTHIVYTPDIQRDQTHFIEVKGYWDEKSNLKKQLMAEQYPEIIIQYIDEKAYLELSHFWSNQIPGWEHDKHTRKRASEE
jgi:hypothetical protein